MPSWGGSVLVLKKPFDLKMGENMPNIKENCRNIAVGHTCFCTADHLGKDTLQLIIRL